ncbi:NUDIX hydrolase [Candidatus Shapirobacteria bacterium]|nr:NUDIX hydrolase [Candidatus Shapirobacteria bacterium]
MTNNAKPWEEIGRETVFKKFGKAVEKVIFRLPDGKEFDYYIKKEGPAACVLALTPDNEVILARQYRPGPKKIVLELPGGYVDLNENPEVGMLRELREETGYEGDVKFVTTCLDDAYSTMERHCFVATNCKLVGEPHLDEDEFIDIMLVPLSDFRDLLRSGQMTDVEVGYLCLDFLKLL